MDSSIYDKDKVVYETLRDLRNGDDLLIYAALQIILAVAIFILALTGIGIVCAIPLVLILLAISFKQISKLKEKRKRFENLLTFEELKSWDMLIARNQCVLVGLVLSATVYGAIIGIPLILYAIYLHFTRKRTKYF